MVKRSLRRELWKFASYDGRFSIFGFENHQLGSHNLYRQQGKIRYLTQAISDTSISFNLPIDELHDHVPEYTIFILHLLIDMGVQRSVFVDIRVLEDVLVNKLDITHPMRNVIGVCQFIDVFIRRLS